MDESEDIEGVSGQEADLTFNVSPDVMKTILESEVLNINGESFLRKDYCVRLVVDFHKNRTLTARVKKFIKNILSRL